MKTRREFLGGMAALGALGLPGCASMAGGEREPATLPVRDEFVIRNAYVMTMDPKAGDLADADVHVKGGAIVAVGRNLKAGSAIALYDVALRLCEFGPVRLSARTKAERGYALRYTDPAAMLAWCEAAVVNLPPLMPAAERSASAWCCQIRNMRSLPDCAARSNFRSSADRQRSKCQCIAQYPKASATRPPEHASRTIAPRYNGNHSIIGLKSAVILGGRNR